MFGETGSADGCRYTALGKNVSQRRKVRKGSFDASFFTWRLCAFARSLLPIDDPADALLLLVGLADSIFPTALALRDLTFFVVEGRASMPSVHYNHGHIRHKPSSSGHNTREG